jgi:hypothetical protein
MEKNNPPDEDMILTALSSIAKSDNKKIEKKYKSKFIYTPSASFLEDMEKIKEVIKPISLPIVDQEIENRSKKYKKECPSDLSKYIVQVREFFLKELSPKTLAGVSGIEQAKKVLEQLLESPIEDQPIKDFKLMLTEAARIKMAKYIGKYMKLSSSEIQRIINLTTPKREVYIPIPPEPRETKVDSKKVKHE